MKRDNGRDLLVVIDMQNDFIGGKLAAPEAEAIMPHALDVIRGFAGDKIFTMDTHDERYPETNEGQHLPIEHCVRGTWGWELDSRIAQQSEDSLILEKPTFGSLELGAILSDLDKEAPVRSVTMIGLVTDICVLSNAVIAKAALPYSEILVDAAATAGTTPENKETALGALEAIHVIVKNRHDARSGLLSD